MPYTLTQASKACGKSKATLLRAIRAGRISAGRDEAAGSWLIEPAELHRLYPASGGGAVRDAPDDEARNGHDAAETVELRARLADAHDTISDLRRRLDTATEQLGEALQQVRLLSDQRTAPPAAVPVRRSWWPWRGRRSS
jgi:hypothetical protein